MAWGKSTLGEAWNDKEPAAPPKPEDKKVPAEAIPEKPKTSKNSATE